MPWFKVDDGFHGHPKVIGLSASAVGLWLLAGTWAAQYLTDGKVPSGMVPRFGGSADDASELVASGLWHVSDGGYSFHEWAKYQPTKEDVEAEREAARERMRSVRAKRKGTVANTGEGSEEVRLTPTQPSPAQPDPAQPPISDEMGNSSSGVAVATPRPEIDRLLNILDTEIIRNGGRAPKRTKKNIDAVRLMLDRDGYTADQIERAIRWCQADEFWRANILSASKLREKYEQLRAAAARPSHGHAAPDDKFHDTLERGRRLAAMHQGEIAS